MDNNKKKLVSNVLALGVLGGLEASWAPMVPFVKANMQLNDGQFGNMLLAMGLGSVCALPTVGPLITKFGPRMMAFLGGILLGLSLIGISIGSSPLILPIFLAIFGASLIALDVSSNVNAVVVEKLYNRPLMSGFHGGYSFGTIVGALLMSALLNLGAPITISAVCVAVFMVGGMFVFCRALESDVSAFNEEHTDVDANLV